MLRSTSTDAFNVVRGSVSQIHVRPSSAASIQYAHGGASSHGVSALGINRQWYGQLALLAVNLVCCGGIVGLSRLLPQLAEEQFHQHR
jgi:hypothetical protein